MDDGIGTARLSGGEIDDQAVAEIGELVGEPMTAGQLIALASAGQLVVARGPCGQLPEIIGAAWMAAGEGGGVQRLVCRVNPSLAGRGLEARLRAALKAQLRRRSLFRQRDRAPLGLAPAFRLQAVN